VTILLVVIGLALRVWQYLANNSLFVDEAALARNIIDRPPLALFLGLDYAQSAPVGFLLVQKAIVTVFGTSEYALRALPLACGILALCLFWGMAQRVLSGWSVTFAVGLFSLGLPFIIFSSLVKPYSSDIAIAVLILLASIEIRRRGVTPGRALLIGVIGGAAVWFSQPALFVLAGIGVGFLILALEARDYATARMLMTTWVLWGSSSAAAGLLALRSVTASDQAFFQWIWADGFMPMPPQSALDLAWVFRKLTWAFGTFGSGMGAMHGGLGYRWSFVFTLVMIAGLWGLWKTQRDVALFLALPIVVTAGVSGLEVYPFTARLLAFLLPSLLLATAAGARHLFTRIPRRLSFLAPAGLARPQHVAAHRAVDGQPHHVVRHLRRLHFRQGEFGIHH
jgi:hypothetical protein